MATPSSILAWGSPWTEEPSRLQSMGSQRVGHDWARTHALYSKLESVLEINLSNSPYRWGNWGPEKSMQGVTSIWGAVLHVRVPCTDPGVGARMGHVLSLFLRLPKPHTGGQWTDFKGLYSSPRAATKVPHSWQNDRNILSHSSPDQKAESRGWQHWSSWRFWRKIYALPLSLLSDGCQHPLAYGCITPVSAPISTWLFLWVSNLLPLKRTWVINVVVVV